ncbi:hypothetical protein [Francisella adeliensis]|nr:hypothetical protein [Francisella adeliensis]MBK2086448.1 hypothetical protein [Francisella adeliensis]MBK2096076.1 hypothetical protein [Francisella adeliensis]QIW12608.1 hypothetical protein FZC43_08120 [Francisella adeliensis]QIW14481.1 hypothetical protein FZC44_08115 [Francisella adeliensis]
MKKILAHLIITLSLSYSYALEVGYDNRYDNKISDICIITGKSQSPKCIERKNLEDRISTASKYRNR